MTTTRIAVFAALPWECRPALRTLNDVRRDDREGCESWLGHAPGLELRVVRTGMGFERAVRAARSLAGEGRFDLYLSTGCAGGLRPDLAPGDLAVATSVLHTATGARFEANAEESERARSAAAGAGMRAFAGPIACSNGLIDGRDAKWRVAVETGAIAIEMEGAGVAMVAHEAGARFAAVRSILDPLDVELGATGGFVDPATGRVRPGALVGYVFRRTDALPRLIAMGRMMAAARQSLERFFGAFVLGQAAPGAPLKEKR